VGLATVRVLFGDVNPSGHLAETFPIKLSDNPSYLFYGGEKDKTDYREGIFVGYRYYDRKEMNVLYPFGHGLSYTTFEYSDLELSRSEITDQETVTARVTVTNTGSRSGKTVVQLYVSDVQSTVLRPVRELKGFEKVELAPGESKEVTFTLDKRSFAYWNEQISDWHVETGEFVIEIGQSSRDICLSESVNVISTVKLPRKYTVDTIVMDIMEDEEATEALKPIIEAIGSTLHPQHAGNEAAREAISDEMTIAMMKYMPLRGALSFGGGAIERTGIQGLLEMPEDEA